MSYENVCRAVEKLRRRYGENDPFQLCAEMGIIVIPQALGTDADSIKGFFLESNRIKTITVNSDLPNVIQKIIVSHELGHAVLHRQNGVHAFHEVGLFDESTLMEKKPIYSRRNFFSMIRMCWILSTATQRSSQWRQHCMFRSSFRILSSM